MSFSCYFCLGHWSYKPGWWPSYITRNGHFFHEITHKALALYMIINVDGKLFHRVDSSYSLALSTKHNHVAFNWTVSYYSIGLYHIIPCEHNQHNQQNISFNIIIVDSSNAILVEVQCHTILWTHSIYQILKKHNTFNTILAYICDPTIYIQYPL